MDSKTIRVLIADDQENFRQMVQEFLARLPNVSVVAETSNGAQVVDLVKKFLPDILLLDIAMPNQNGLEATRIIKSRWPSVKVVLTTLHDNPVYRSQAQEVHADSYLLKSSLKSGLDAIFRSVSSPDQQSNPPEQAELP